MQTDSLLKPYDRVVLEEMIHESDVGNRIARELSRLEQENQRLREYNALSRIAEVESENRQLRVESDAIKASMFSVLTALKLGDHVRPQSWSEVVSDEIVPAIERLQTRVDSLDCAHKLALGEVERLKENEDHLTRLAILGPALTAARAEIQRLRSEMEANPATEAVIAERTNLRAEVQRLKKDNHRLRLEAEGLEEVARRWQASWNVERNDLSAFRAEVQRLRDELDAEKIASTYWQDQYNIRNDVAISVGDQLAAARAEVQRLRENAEMDKAQRAEWQETIDKLEAENASIRNQLRLALIISEPKQVDSVMERIEKMESDASRVALLEGRIQGIAEAAKERLDSHDFRLRALEANGWSGIPVTVASNIPPFNQGYNDGKPARNPFEDLRPPRGL